MVESTSSDDVFRPDESVSHPDTDEVTTVSESQSNGESSILHAQQSFSLTSNQTARNHSQGRTHTFTPESDQPLISSSSAQVIPKLQDNPHALEPTYFIRSNRYFGPESTWLSWTENERTTAASLDRLRATDLSLHLFNAFSLKRKRKDSVDKVVVDDHPPACSNPTHPDDLLAQRFIPSKQWTAWPLPPATVPRETFNIGTDSSWSKRNPRSSSELEACLITIAVKIARLRWQQREVESTRDASLEPPLTANKHAPADLPDEANEDESDGTADYGDSHHMSSISDIEPASEPDPTLDSMNSIQYFSSQAFRVPSLSASTHAEQLITVATSDEPPVFSADDESTEKLLQPSCRHIISVLSDLLCAVHNSRKRYTYGNYTRSRSQSQNGAQSQGQNADDVQSAGLNVNAMMEDRPQSRQDRNVQSRRRSVNRTSSRSSPQIAALPSNSSQNRSGQPARSFSSALQPHDWSSVIGLATMLGGFTPGTVARASERCARLFQENMSFRKFQEAGSNADQDAISGVQDESRETHPSYDEYYAAISESETSTVSSGDDGDRGLPKLKWKVTRACVNCHQLKQKCEIGVGTRQPEVAQSCQRCILNLRECIGLRTQVETHLAKPRRRVTCPFIDCERHITGFLKSSHLKRHLTVAHKTDEGRRIPGRTASSDGNSSRKVSEVENDKCYCPVEGCARAEGGRPFGRGTKMYEHVRRSHPEMDIDEIKKAEVLRRGERRGRWMDNRRYQSRSRDRASSGSRNPNGEQR